MQCERRLIGVLLVALIFGGVACDSDTPTAPTNPFVGTWSGILTDASIGTASLTLMFQADPVASPGTWSALIAGQPVTGSLLAVRASEGGSVRYLLTGSCPGGGFFSVNVLFEAIHMRGPYGAFACAGLTSGTIDVLK